MGGGALLMLLRFNSIKSVGIVCVHCSGIIAKVMLILVFCDLWIIHQTHYIYGLIQEDFHHFNVNVKNGTFGRKAKATEYRLK